MAQRARHRRSDRARQSSGDPQGGHKQGHASLTSYDKLTHRARRNPQPDELTRTFEHYNKLNREAAREIGQRVKVRYRNASAADITAGA